MKTTPKPVETPPIYCDICGESCLKMCGNESAELKATWGFDSRKDLSSYEIDLCENCFDKTLTFLHSIKTSKHSIEPRDYSL